jgi:DNA polymerase III sliding clamp (beta) subunit (PCNA family)
MKLVVSKDLLKDAVAIASKALSKAVIQTERGHLLFIVSGSTMRISGTNNDLKSQCIVPLISCDSDISFTVDPKVLEKLITKIDHDNLSMEFESSNLTIKIYTTEDESSFNTLQSFPTDKMLTVGAVDKALNVSHTINKELFSRVLTYAWKYLETSKEENKKFDFIIVNNGVIFASNGLNKMGFLIATDFKGINNIKIRKQAVPLFMFVVKSIKGNSIILGEQDNDVVIKTEDSQVYFSCLKSTVEAPKINLDYLKKDGPYTEINRTDLIKKLNRLTVSKLSTNSAGIEMTLSGAGDTASLELALLSNLKAKEKIGCKRVDDTSTQDVSHIVDYKLFLTEISSFLEENIHLYINASNASFKIHEVTKDEEKGLKYITVGVGSYSRIIKK